jgi:hypothetical protein
VGRKADLIFAMLSSNRKSTDWDAKTMESQPERDIVLLFFSDTVLREKAIPFC